MNQRSGWKAPQIDCQEVKIITARVSLRNTGEPLPLPPSSPPRPPVPPSPRSPLPPVPPSSLFHPLSRRTSYLRLLVLQFISLLLIQSGSSSLLSFRTEPEEGSWRERSDFKACQRETSGNNISMSAGVSLLSSFISHSQTFKRKKLQ